MVTLSDMERAQVGAIDMALDMVATGSAHCVACGMELRLDQLTDGLCQDCWVSRAVERFVEEEYEKRA